MSLICGEPARLAARDSSLGALLCALDAVAEAGEMVLKPSRETPTPDPAPYVARGGGRWYLPRSETAELTAAEGGATPDCGVASE